jgi:NAD(P)-dependent dehydrogenase (short-subunit alcohol dehydrogenase family)
MSLASGRKSIFITGAASGMGLETARLFAAEGWFVGGYDVNGPGLDALAAELGPGNGIFEVLDVTNRQGYAAALDRFSQATDGRLDILFNNAGIGRGGPFAEQDFDDILAVVNVNLVGVLNGIRLAIDLLKATPGSLCFSTSSSSAIFGAANIAVYSATKHAVKGLTEALSVEFAPLGVRVADALPGVIDTPLIPREWAENAPQEGMWRLVPPVEVARVVWRAYTEDRVHWYVPEELFPYDVEITTDPVAARNRIIANRAP